MSLTPSRPAFSVHAHLPVPPPVTTATSPETSFIFAPSYVAVAVIARFGMVRLRQVRRPASCTDIIVFDSCAHGLDGPESHVVNEINIGL